MFHQKKEQGRAASTLHFPVLETEITKKHPNCLWTLKDKLPVTPSTFVLGEYNAFCPHRRQN